MMDAKKEITHFTVDPQLAILLGETYSSSEVALKELVDNSWDADAEDVEIIIPTEILSTESIIIEDNGYGMTFIELQNEYLNIAQNRIVKKGEKTPKDRLIKGRKGIGKFAGLIAANNMTVETWSRGQYSILNISKDKILNSPTDIENIELPVALSSCDKKQHGTKITLSGLNQSLNYPSDETLKQILFAEYCYCDDFNIYINNNLLTIEQAKPDLNIKEINLPEAGKVVLKIGISHKNIPLRQAGIQLKVGGKNVGRPSFFGLEESEDIPKKQLKRIYGEIEVDALEDFVLGNWSGIVENSKGFQEVKKYLQIQQKEILEQSYPQEYNLALARLKKKYYRSIELLPEYKREFAKKALENVLAKYFGDNERIETIISVILEALQKDEYWIIIEKLEQADETDVELLADVLNEFGLVEIALISKQADNRKKFLDRFEILVKNRDTTEWNIHKSLEKNLWIISNQLTLYKSNKTIKHTVEEYTNNKYSGKRAKKRPDLILLNNINQDYLLIELKKYYYDLKLGDATQALEYGIDLRPYFGEIKEILVIGGKLPKDINKNDIPLNVTLETYDRVIGKARSEIDWLLNEFTDKRNLQN